MAEGLAKRDAEAVAEEIASLKAKLARGETRINRVESRAAMEQRLKHLQGL